MRFVRGVHRRLVFVRAAERSGACVGVASIFACAFASVAFIQGREAMQLVLALLAIGAISGIFWGLSRRPTRFEAIVEADRQLNLSDLLASAYAQRDSDDPWQRAVVAIADARCRSLAPSQVIVHRYGGRAWGGIGLAAALGLTLALLSGVPQDSRARAVAARSSPAAGELSAEAADPGAAAMAESASPRSHDAMDSARRADARAVVESGSNDVDAPQPSTSDNTLARTNDAADARARAGAGEKAGQSTAASGDALPRPANHGGDNASADATATPAGGGAADDARSREAKSPSEPGGGKTSADRVGVNRQSPPWSSPSWDADRAAAGEAMRTGRVPDSYRDVVSEYFRPGDRDSKHPVSP